MTLFKPGDLLRYADGETALMEVINIQPGHGGSIAYYGGIQCMGGYVHAYHEKCHPASAQDRLTWKKKREWREDTPGVQSLKLSDRTFSERNLARCESPTGFNHKLSSWSLSDWLTATTGELGEAANIIKKLNRVRDGIPGNKESAAELREKLADELADVAVYLDLLTQAAGFDLEEIREAKFNKKSVEIGYSES